MKVAYLLTPGTAHSHDFQTDFLLTGLYAVLGFDNVLDWPEKESLHVTPDRGMCDACRYGYDSDQCWPRKGHTLEDALQAADVLIVNAQPGDYNWGQVTQALAAWPRHKPAVAVDGSDSVAGAVGNTTVEQHHAFYRSVVGGPLAAFFKRELRIGDHWALPLPLSYPAGRVPMLKGKYKRIFYHASHHGGAGDGPGFPRLQIAEQLRQFCDKGVLDMHLSEPSGQRLTPAEYHARQAESLIGISWNGAPYIPTWDCNRVWENFAYGLAQVVQRPTIRIPHAPIDGTHCVYVDSVDEVAPACAKLLAEPQRAMMIAQAGHMHFLRYHTSEARASYLLNVLQQVC